MQRLSSAHLIWWQREAVGELNENVLILFILIPMDLHFVSYVCDVFSQKADKYNGGGEFSLIIKTALKWG